MNNHNHNSKTFCQNFIQEDSFSFITLLFYDEHKYEQVLNPFLYSLFLGGNLFLSMTDMQI